MKRDTYYADEVGLGLFLATVAFVVALLVTVAVVGGFIDLTVLSPLLAVLGR